MSTSTSTSTSTKIKSSDIKPGDIIKFEYGAYNNWVTVRIDEVSIDPTHHTHYSQKLIWHYLSDEPKEAPEPEPEAPKDCRAEKLGNNHAPSPSPALRQFTCYSNPNDLVEKLN